MVLTEFQKPRFIFFEVYARTRTDALQCTACFFAKLFKCCFDMFNRCAAFAADAEHTDFWNKVQRIALRVECYGKIGLMVLVCRENIFRLSACDFPLRVIINHFTGEQCAADGFDTLRLEHVAVLRFRPLVYGEHAFDVGRGRDDRHCVADAREFLGKVICAAEVTGQNRNGKPTALIEHNHSGIGRLAFTMRRNGAHGDADSADEDECIGFLKVFGCPIG